MYFLLRVDAFSLSAAPPFIQFSGSSFSNLMVVFKWKNNSCTDAALQVMQNAAKKVEDKILRDAVKGAHIPTLLNDELYPTSVAVAV